jgi:hypothetical protein
MEIRDIYYSAMLLFLAIAGIIWVRDQMADMKREIALTKQEQANQKEDQLEIKKRVDAHEEKMDEKFNQVFKKLDGLKDLLINKHS